MEIETKKVGTALESVKESARKVQELNYDYDARWTEGRYLKGKISMLYELEIINKDQWGNIWNYINVTLNI